jgi:hypothetical protein
LTAPQQNGQQSGPQLPQPPYQEPATPQSLTSQAVTSHDMIFTLIEMCNEKIADYQLNGKLDAYSDEEMRLDLKDFMKLIINLYETTSPPLVKEWPNSKTKNMKGDDVTVKVLCDAIERWFNLTDYTKEFTEQLVKSNTSVYGYVFQQGIYLYKMYKSLLTEVGYYKV